MRSDGSMLTEFSPLRSGVMLKRNEASLEKKEVKDKRRSAQKRETTR